MKHISNLLDVLVQKFIIVFINLRRNRRARTRIKEPNILSMPK